MGNDDELRIEARQVSFDPELLRELEQELSNCPDLAFAHLPQVYVPGRQQHPEPVLFVWLLPQALRSLRSALNLVSEAVARVLPSDVYLDVVVLNSAPEMLADVERAGCLLVERDPAERQRALSAAAGDDVEVLGPQRPWWWPF